MNLNNLLTETRNPKSANIDELSTLDMLKVINDEDKSVAFAVEKTLPEIAKAVDVVAEKLAAGGRLFYIGAGTSGRLGVLDAAECPPTFGVDCDMVEGVIAGGTDAIFKAVEGAEDSLTLAEIDLKKRNFSNKDVLVGIAASGRTPYVLGGLKYARSIGATTIALACVKNPKIAEFADISLNPLTGAEVITGSTRMKAGTAQKMTLNMITSGAMIKLGKVYGNLMVDVKASNEKLIERAINIVMTAANATREDSEKALKEANYSAKLAIFMLLTHKSLEVSQNVLKATPNLKEALKKYE